MKPTTAETDESALKRIIVKKLAEKQISIPEGTTSLVELKIIEFQRENSISCLVILPLGILQVMAKREGISLE